MIFLLPLIAAVPSPAPLFAGLGKSVCNAHIISTSANHFSNKKNITLDQKIANIRLANSMQTLDVKTTAFGTDFTNPSWVSVFALHVGTTYCKTNETSVLSKLGEPLAQIPEGLPMGKFKVEAIEDFEQLQTIGDSKDGRFVVSVSDDQKLIVLSWRGSVNKKDLFADVDGKKLNLTDPLMAPFLDGSASIGNPKCQVPADTTDMFMFSGFAKTMQNVVMEKHVLPKLRAAQAKFPGYSVVINGHSLGAAKAFINAFYLSKFYPDINYKAVYPLSQPLVGSTKLSTWMADCIGPEKIVRAVSENDLVPWLREDVNVQHPATVSEIFNSNANKNQFNTCQGPSDKACSAKYKCTDRTWDTHSRFSGYQIGSICDLIGV